MLFSSVLLLYLNVLNIHINTSEQGSAPPGLRWEAQPQVLRCRSSIRQLATGC